ncbi:tRNA-intron lyase [Haloparvum alkalitolerans]|uniref:tRNA-intron lyase n=1 Tax=Haloparvum alkalitolerans TaxID=1042953 RepID=UPI003CF4FBF5
MQPQGTLRGDAVRVGGDARQRFHDSRGYGRPLSGNEIALSRVEAAHLLFRGDLDAVIVDGDELGFERFFADAAAAADRFAVRFLVYAELRDRGFYLSPTREEWPGGRLAAADPNHAGDADAIDFVVFERGSGPGDGTESVEHRVRVVGEREPIPVAEIAGQTLAVVDEESDITYFAATEPELSGVTDFEPPGDLAGTLLSDRVIVWDAPERLHERGFYGQPLSGRDAAVEGALQLSLVEAAALAAEGRLTLDRAVSDGGGSDGRERSPDTDYDAVVARGRAVEGERFDRRLRTYVDLRAREMVPKTGFKFGADFRTYLDVETVEDLPHSEHLVRVVEPDHVFAPRELSLDVRLAGGVRKRMVFALAGANSIDYRSVARVTP